MRPPPVAKDRESLPRLRSFREYWHRRHGTLDVVPLSPYPATMSPA